MKLKEYVSPANSINLVKLQNSPHNFNATVNLGHSAENWTLKLVLIIREAGGF